MMNIKGNKKANAMPMIAILFIIILVIAVVFIVMNPEVTGESPYWETESNFGMWGEEIIIYYEDGTTDSLKILQDTQPLKVTYGGKEITSVGYEITAKATGAGYTGCELDYSEFYQ